MTYCKHSLLLLHADCINLILWCLSRYPHVRPTFDEILSHAWFTEPQNPQTVKVRQIDKDYELKRDIRTGLHGMYRLSTELSSVRKMAVHV